MNDWKRTPLVTIAGFIREIKKYFGKPLTRDKIINKKFDGTNAWDIEAGSLLIDLIDLSGKYDNETNLDNIIGNILKYYEQEFGKVDFIAKLKYLTTEQGGRKIAAHSGYRPQIKFDFTEMQTSGQQTFIDRETVFPGDIVEAKIKITSPDYFKGSLVEGMKFEFREGETIIGTGQIMEIVNDKLEMIKGTTLGS
ncbi:MAG: hypothetical protein ABI691_22285 [Ginsengibacter sp.]